MAKARHGSREGRREGEERGVTAGPEEWREAGEALVEDDERVGRGGVVGRGSSRGGEEEGGGVGHRRQRHGGRRRGRWWSVGRRAWGQPDRWEKSCDRPAIWCGEVGFQKSQTPSSHVRHGRARQAERQDGEVGFQNDPLDRKGAPTWNETRGQLRFFRVKCTGGS